MLAKETEFPTFIEGQKQFQIPVYQRKYSWTIKNCATLLKDIKKTGSDKNIQNHFLGSIVYVLAEDYQATGVHKLTVIDGQQRLTTLTLLLLALSKAIEKNYTGDLITADAIQRLWLSNTSTTDDDLKRKIVLTEGDNQTLNNILDGIQLPNTYAENVKNNYDYFVKELEQPGIDLDHFIMGIRKLKVVDITLKVNEDDPQLIFESLNATGMALSQTDLIRNFLLMGVKKEIQENLYKKFWKPMEEKITSEHFDKFMKDFLTMKRIDIPIEREVYVTYKDYFYDTSEQNNNDNAKCVEELLYYSEFYEIIALLKTSDREIFDALNSLSTRALRVSVAYPFLLCIFEDWSKKIISKDDVLEIMDTIQSYIFRRQICGLGTSGHGRIFATLYNRIIDTNNRNTYVESIKAALQTQPLKQRFPENEEFYGKLISRDVYNDKSCAYLLMKLENFKRKKEKISILGVVTEGDGVTIEHILPQNRDLKQEWRGELPADWRNVQERCVDKLGNLTITELNSELGDKSFLKKKEEAYDNSIYHLSYGLRQLQHWNEDMINKRSEELAKLALEIWKEPKVSNEILEKFKQEEVEEIDDEEDDIIVKTGWTYRRKRATQEVIQVQDKLINEIKNKFDCVIKPHRYWLYFYTKLPDEAINQFAVINCSKTVFTLYFRVNPKTFTDDYPKVRSLEKKRGWFFKHGRDTERRMRVYDPKDSDSDNKSTYDTALKMIEQSYQVTIEQINYKNKL